MRHNDRWGTIRVCSPSEKRYIVENTTTASIILACGTDQVLCELINHKDNIYENSTGKLDKEDNMIYIGDIITYDREDENPIEVRYTYDTEDNDPAFRLTNRLGGNDGEPLIVGNIHQS